MILRFKDFSIFESWYNDQTNHFPDRFNQRILDATLINLPIDIKSNFDVEKYRELKKKCLELFKNESLKRKEDVLKKEFYLDQNTAYPLISFFVLFKGKEYPVEITSKYYDPEKQREMESVGSKFLIPIVKNELKTVLAYPGSMDMSQVEDNLIKHLDRINLQYDLKNRAPFKGIIQNSGFKYILEIDETGNVHPYVKSITVNPNYYTRDQQYNLAKGRKLKVPFKFSPDGFIEGSVDGIINKSKDKTIADKFISLIVSTDRGKLKKDLKPNDIVYLPVSEEGDYVRCMVMPPSYIIDKRLDEPVNLKFRAV